MPTARVEAIYVFQFQWPLPDVTPWVGILPEQVWTGLQWSPPDVTSSRVGPQVWCPKGYCTWPLPEGTLPNLSWGVSHLLTYTMSIWCYLPRPLPLCLDRQTHLSKHYFPQLRLRMVITCIFSTFRTLIYLHWLKLWTHRASAAKSKRYM